MDDRAIVCPACGAWCERTLLFQAHGFRRRVPCRCGEIVETGLDLSDLPAVCVDFAASTVEQLRAGFPVVRIVRRHEGVDIDAGTPLWVLL